MPRKILHIDLDAFFCAVEELRDPSLAGKAFAVGGSPEQRGVVASCSYAARQYGIRSAMPMARALKLCPDLIILRSRHGVYSNASRQVMEILNNLTPLVEQISIDEAFLDVSDLQATGESIARQLQKTIQTELRLPCSLGVATNKLIAKMANDFGKAKIRGILPPNAITVVPPGEEASFIAPLPVEALWGIGPKTAARLDDLGIKTIGDLAQKSESELAKLFGKFGGDIYLRSRGIDDRPITVYHEAKSISQEVTFARDISEEGELMDTLRKLSEKVGRRLRENNLCGTTIRIKVRWPDFTTITRQKTLNQATDQDAVIDQIASSLFRMVWTIGKRVRLIGVGVSGLGPPVRQLGFWDSDSDKDRRLQAAFDDIRGRYGSLSLQRGLHGKNEQDG